MVETREVALIMARSFAPGLDRCCTAGGLNSSLNELPLGCPTLLGSPTRLGCLNGAARLAVNSIGQWALKDEECEVR